MVWNFGQYAPEAQVTSQTGLLLQGDTQAERIADTGATWKAARNPAYEPIPITHGQVRGYFVAGPGERINGASYPWGWERADFNDESWTPAVALGPGAPRHASDGPNRWMLVPRSIPLMEETAERIANVRKASGADVPAGFPKQPAAWTVPANSKAHLLLDQSYLTTAYPELIVSGGKVRPYPLATPKRSWNKAITPARFARVTATRSRASALSGTRRVYSRRRREQDVSSAVVAHMALPGFEHRNEGRAADD